VYCVLRACRKVDSKDIVGRREANKRWCILVAWESVSDVRLEASFRSSGPLVLVGGSVACP
jgi:hypothetical protein